MDDSQYPVLSRRRTSIPIMALLILLQSTRVVVLDAECGVRLPRPVVVLFLALSSPLAAQRTLPNSASLQCIRQLVVSGERDATLWRRVAAKSAKSADVAVRVVPADVVGGGGVR